MGMKADAGGVAVKAILVVVGVLISVGIGLVACEVWLRIKHPDSTFKSAFDMDWFRKSDIDYKQLFEIDPDFGFRPVLGNEYYTAQGVKVHNYDPKGDSATKRILFIGDSVTARGQIIDQLKKRCGEANHQYYNAGVESFCTVQEVNFYKKFNATLKPDQVILTFHNNDFAATPVAFFDKDNKLVVYSPFLPLKYASRILFKISFLYRFYVGWQLRKTNYSMNALVNEVRESLRELRDILAKDRVDFVVLVLPIMQPYAKWSNYEKMSRATILRILQGLQIRHFDLLPVIVRAERQGIDILKDQKDTWHPSPMAAAYFAEYLCSNPGFGLGSSD